MKITCRPDYKDWFVGVSLCFAAAKNLKTGIQGAGQHNDKPTNKLQKLDTKNSTGALHHDMMIYVF